MNDAAEGFGYDSPIENLDTPATLPGIETIQTVTFKPLCGLFQQSKYIPLRYCPIEFELELAGQHEPSVTPGIDTVCQTDNT